MSMLSDISTILPLYSVIRQHRSCMFACQGQHGSIDALERSLHPLEDRRGFVKQRAITTLSLLLLLSFFRLIVKTVHRVI